MPQKSFSTIYEASAIMGVLAVTCVVVKCLTGAAIYKMVTRFLSATEENKKNVDAVY